MRNDAKTGVLISLSRSPFAPKVAPTPRALAATIGVARPV